MSEKYNIEYYSLNKKNDFKKALKNADRMLKEIHDILKNDRWNNLFVENIGDLILLAASHVRDYGNTEAEFGVKLTQQRQYHYYPKSIFSAILKYFEVSKLLILYVNHVYTIHIESYFLSSLIFFPLKYEYVFRFFGILHY